MSAHDVACSSGTLVGVSARMNEHDAARSRFGAMSGCCRSSPVSMMPTRAPLPWFTAYEPSVVALIIRMSHWHGDSGSGPLGMAMSALE